MNYDVKKQILLIAALTYLSSCANLRKLGDESQAYPSTMTSDLNSTELSRTDYNTKIADNYLEKKLFEQAVDQYRLALLHDNKNTKARFGLARSYSNLGQNHLALIEFNIYLAENQNDLKSDHEIKILSSFYENIKLYDHVYEINRKHFEISLSQPSLWKMYEASLALKEYDQAFSVLDLIQNHEASVQQDQIGLVHLSKAVVYNLQKDYKNELAEIKLAEDLKPYDEMILKRKMQALQYLQKWDQVISTGLKYIKYQKHTVAVSEQIFSAAVSSKNYELADSELDWQAEFSKDKDLFKLKKAHLNYLKQEYETAEKEYKNLKHYEKFEDEIKYYLALIYDQTNRQKTAVYYLSQIENESLYYADAQARLAVYEYNAGRKNDALYRLKDALTEKSESLVLYRLYSDYLIENNYFIESIQVLNQGLESNKNNEELHLNLAFCYYKLKNTDEFKKHFDMAMILNPANSRAYEIMAELWYLDEKKSSEIEYFIKISKELGSENKGLIKVLAWVLSDQNQLDKAVALFEKMYDQNPKDYFYTEMLAQIYSQKNIRSKALEFRLRAQSMDNDLEIKDELNRIVKTQIENDKEYLNESHRKPASFE